MKATTYHISKFMSENDLCEVNNVCPICNANVEHSRLCLIQKSPDIYLCKCQFCKGSYASKMPTDAVLKRYYSNYYSVNSNQKVTFHNSVMFAKHILNNMRLTVNDKNKLTILDFGGGSGAIAKELAQSILKTFPNIKNITVFVVDYNSFQDYEENSIVYKSRLSLNEVDCKCNIIIASAILEHIPYVNKTFKQLFNLISKEGCFYARTPYIAPFMEIIQKIDMTYPAHVYDLGADFWNRIIETFAISATIVKSQPSIVETSFQQSCLRTIAAHLLKFPAYIERWLFPKNKDILWKYVGGWEVFLKFE